MIYRKEIDGLRALAVSSVVIYHFFPNILPNGYLGVDIFFIISGYLITQNILRNKGTFTYTLKYFYERRFKRLFPALFVFLTLTALGLVFIFIKSDYENFITSLFAAKTFWANIYFWRDGGYFGGNDQLKPLLHTWSLSVEEQFYIFYPSFLIFSFWVRKKIGLPIVVFVGILTILSFVIWIFLNKIGGETPAFFLLPTRIWQFGLGSFFAILQLREYSNIFKYSQIISIISFVLILIGLLIKFDNQTLTLIVSFGTVLFLFFTLNENNFIIFALKSYLFTSIGKISYSVYLYHWPVAVVLVYYYVSEPPLLVSLLGIFISFFFGMLSYRFVEVPFRYQFNLKSSVILIFACALISFSIFKFQNNYTKQNDLDTWAETTGTNYRCPISSYFPYGALRACLLEEGELNKKDKILLLGNSHAQMYAPLFSESLKETGLGGILVPLNDCLPTTSVNVNLNCFKYAKKNLKTIMDDKDHNHIFISMTWYNSKYKDENGRDVEPRLLINSVIDLINQIKSSGKTVYLISPIPIPNQELSSELPRKYKFNWSTKKEIYNQTLQDREKYDQQFKSFNLKFEKILGKNYIKVYDDLCDLRNCYFVKDNIMYFSDASHLSQKIMKKLISSKKQVINILERLR